MNEGARRIQPDRPDAGAALFETPVVLYDGWCSLCDSTVAFILRRDRRAVMRFATLQSPVGQTMLAGCASAGRLDETLVVVYRGRCTTRSDALVIILRHLPRPWSGLAWMRLVPRGLRDRGYDVVARYRRRWFGRPEVCMTSLGGYRDRFLE